MSERIGTTPDGTIGCVFKKAGEAQRAVARLRAAGFADVRLSERSGTTAAEHVAPAEGITESDFAATLVAAGFSRGDADALTAAVADGGTLVTLAAGPRLETAVAALRGDAVAAAPVSAVDLPPPVAYDEGAAASAAVPATAPTRAATATPAPNATPAPDATTPATDQRGDRVLELREERLDVNAVRTQREARIRKEVVTETKTITVPVQREELVIERDGEDPVRVPVSDREPPSRGDGELR